MKLMPSNYVKLWAKAWNYFLVINLAIKVVIKSEEVLEASMEGYELKILLEDGYKELQHMYLAPKGRALPESWCSATLFLWSNKEDPPHIEMSSS